jgi:NMD protein affecting ribosome stability and mRNA decay
MMFNCRRCGDAVAVENSDIASLMMWLCESCYRRQTSVRQNPVPDRT